LARTIKLLDFRIVWYGVGLSLILGKDFCLVQSISENIKLLNDDDYLAKDGGYGCNILWHNGLRCKAITREERKPHPLPSL